jgi:4-amino-4-deoxy-L-arabinose transferase-like glycosyltransferase
VRWRWLVWLGCTAAISLWLVSAAGRNLENFRPVSNDEGELLEVSYTLATTGRLASPMYTGFFDAEDHHLWTLPLQHVLDAAAFKAFGAGIAQARWVSLAAALVSLWTLGWLALRWYGLTAALLTEVLLVFWRSDLTQGITGLPLLDVARVARYDVLAIAFGWLAIAALDLAITNDSRGTARKQALAAGFLGGLAALTQFYGVFALPVVLLGAPSRRAVVGGAALALAPWLAFVAWYHADLAGQLSVYGQRGDFLNPAFYADNIASEPARYANILAQRIPDDVVGASEVAFQTSLYVLLALVPALVWRISRAVRCPKRRGDRLLLLSLASSAGLLLVVDQTKTPLYAIVLVPPVCLLLASGGSDLARLLRQGSRPWLGSLAAAATVALLVAVIADGLRAYTVDRAESAQVTPYASVGRQIEAALPADGVVLGPERWWWALHARPYVSLRSLWFQWQSHDGATTFMQLIERWQPRSVIVNNNVRDDIRAFPPAMQ